MIDDIINNMINATKQLQEAIILDIEDVKLANHESLLSRNDLKLNLIDTISSSQQKLTDALANEIEKNDNIDVYKNNINKLEDELKKLYELNGKLAAIVLPVKQMYSDIISEIEKHNGGSLLEMRV